MQQTNKYPWGHSKRYNDYSSYFKNRFSERVQKISIDAGFTCPNRDGSKGRGGCTYCNNDTFNPYYCMPSKSVSKQLDEGISFFSPKYKTQQYLCYFQAYSNTYGEFERLKKIWTEALSHQGVIGMVVGTRPDCVNDQILDYLAELSKKFYIVLEFGIESTLNRTLELVNRCHTYEESVEAIKQSTDRGIETGVHMILGLPGESRSDLLQHAVTISELPITSLKLHHLQIIKKTIMAKQYASNPKIFDLFEANEYVKFIVEFLKHLSPQIIVERFISESPLDLLIAPKWEGLKNFEIVHRIEKQLESSNSWQGMLYNQTN
ncbi:MAG: TIGR01212 family radical SAM protein [Bacteroidales bacterium]|nr:TIGR01212 family radical SAM protein [Bacteroidales bacterium]